MVVAEDMMEVQWPWSQQALLAPLGTLLAGLGTLVLVDKPVVVVDILVGLQHRLAAGAVFEGTSAASVVAAAIASGSC